MEEKSPDGLTDLELAQLWHLAAALVSIAWLFSLFMGGIEEVVFLAAWALLGLWRAHRLYRHGTERS